MKQHIIPAVLAFVFGILLWQIQKEKTELIYQINDSELFPLDSTVAKFFVFDLKNVGNKEIEGINIDIEFSNGKIQNYNFSDLQNAKFTQEASKITGNITLLNPNESLKIKCTVIGEISQLKKFSARAKGITATPESIADYSFVFIPLVAIIFVIIILGFYYITYMQTQFDKAIESFDFDSIEAERTSLTDTVNEKINQSQLERNKWLENINKENEEREKNHQEFLKNLEERQRQREKEHEKYMEELKEEQKNREKDKEEIKQGRPERNQLIFRCLNKHSLSHLYFKILNLGDGMTYLNTGYILFIEFLINDNEKYIKAIQSLSEYDMAPTSKGMLYYLAGKMESKRNNHERVNYWLNKCKDEFPLLYKFLMEEDEHFNLNQLIKELRSN